MSKNLVCSLIGVVALGLWAACATEAAPPSASDASLAASRAATFIEHGAGYRADSASHLVDVVAGSIELAPKPPAAGARPSALGSVSLVTSAARRGASALELTVLESGLSAPDVVETVRADFIELLRNTETGAEQSWRFSQPPGGSGDLVVEVTPSGVSYSTVTATGLHFTSAQLQMTYGHGTWIDADGDRWSIPATYLNGHISLTVPASVLSSSAFPAVLDPQIIVSPIGGQPPSFTGSMSLNPQIIVSPIGG